MKEQKPISLNSLVIPGAYFRANLKPVEFSVLLYLAAHANFKDAADAGRCWPSVARLSVLTGLSKRGVQYSIEKLVAAQLVEIKCIGGGRKSTVYLLHHIAEMVNEKDSAPTAAVHPMKQPETVSVNGREHKVNEIISTLITQMKRTGACKNEASLRRALSASYRNHGAAFKGRLITTHGSAAEALDVTQGVGNSSPGMLRPR